MPASEREHWKHFPTRHDYHALRLLQEGAEMERAVKHVVDVTDFQNIRAPVWPPTWATCRRHGDQPQLIPLSGLPGPFQLGWSIKAL